jgi:hypothetical protein
MLLLGRRLVGVLGPFRRMLDNDGRRYWTVLRDLIVLHNLLFQKSIYRVIFE